MAKKRVFWLATGGSMLILLLILMQKKCSAQPPTVSLCSVLEIEKRIEKLESDTKILLEKKRAERSTNPSAAVTLPLPTFKSVWEGAAVQRPSEIFQVEKESCQTIDLQNEDYRRQLQKLEEKAEKRLENIAAGGFDTPTVADTPNKTPSNLPENKPANPTTAPQKKEQPTAHVPANLSVEEAEKELPSVQHYYSLAIQWKNKTYYCMIVNPRSPKIEIDFLWKNPDGKPLENFENAQKLLATQKKQAIMMMNAGIFDEKLAPLGAFYSHGKKLRAFNKAYRPGAGNFYLDTAGVFILEKDGRARIRTKWDFRQHLADTSNIQYATQSGPMLVFHGKIHPVFEPESNNLHIRNGVGVMPDGNVLFILSAQAVNFYEFSEVFLKRFKCSDALYLDGTISKMYLPALNLSGHGGRFAGIISIAIQKE